MKKCWNIEHIAYNNILLSKVRLQWSHLSSSSRWLLHQSSWSLWRGLEGLKRSDLWKPHLLPWVVRVGVFENWTFHVWSFYSTKSSKGYCKWVKNRIPERHQQKTDIILLWTLEITTCCETCIGATRQAAAKKLTLWKWTWQEMPNWSFSLRPRLHSARRFNFIHTRLSLVETQWTIQAFGVICPTFAQFSSFLNWRFTYQE